MKTSSWYNTERVAQKGSVILQQWVKTHGPAHRKTVTNVAQRGYGGAQYGRTVTDWIAQSTNADSELITSLRTLRNRSRQLVRDNEYAKHIIDRVIPNNVVGQGIKFQSQVMKRRGNKLDDVINDRIEKAWATWGKADNCHTAGKMSFADLERCIIRSTAEGGEILVRMVKQRFGKSTVPFALELIEPDQLVDNYSGRANDGNEIRMGVEVDEWQRPVAYWLYPRHPGDYAFASTAPSNTWQRVPASEVLHIGLFDRPGQTRCVPWMHATMLKLRHIGGTEEAEIVATRASAAIMGFVQSPELDMPGGPTDPGDADDVMNGEKVFDMSPGIIKQLAPGETFSGFNPSRPNTGLEGFLRYMLRGVSVGLGISYATATGDYSQSNYSSSRMSLLDDRDNWRVLQQWMIRSFHQKVYEAWLEMAVLSGTLDLPAFESAPEVYQDIRWMPRGWEWVDPAKEVAAAKAAVRCGFMNVADEIAAKGGDIEDVFKQRRRELDLAATYDLILETDPAQVDDKGVVQPLSPVAETDTCLDENGNPLAGGQGPTQDDAETTDTTTEKDIST